METTDGIHSWRVGAPSRRLVIALGLVAALAGLAIAALIWLRSYAPLEWSGTGSFGPDVRSTGYVRQVEPAIGSEGKTVYFVRSGPFTFGFDLHNSGPLPVQIDGVVTGGRPFSITGLGLQPPNSGAMIDGAPSFHPFTLHSDGYRFLVVHLRTQSCAAAQLSYGGSSVLSAIELRYSYAGIFHRSAWVDLPAAVNLTC